MFIEVDQSLVWQRNEELTQEAPAEETAGEPRAASRYTASG
jgi:hypothetical protein